MRIKELLQENRNVNKIDKEIILSHLLKVKQKDLILYQDKDIDKNIIIEYQQKEKRLEKEPVQYILNQANFYGFDFYVDRNVLIPRPETEHLVEKVNELIKETFSDEVKILDVGTGSGVIAITLKKINKHYDIYASDISKKALFIAKKNAETLNAKITFIKSNMLQNIFGKYDVLISNPPYIPENATNIEKKVKENEPKLALYGGKDGLFFYKRLLKDAINILNSNNIIAFEIGDKQAEEIESIALKYFPHATILKENDYNNQNRYLYIINKNE